MRDSDPFPRLTHSSVSAALSTPDPRALKRIAPALPEVPDARHLPKRHRFGYSLSIPQRWNQIREQLDPPHRAPHQSVTALATACPSRNAVAKFVRIWTPPDTPTHQSITALAKACPARNPAAKFVSNWTFRTANPPKRYRFGYSPSIPQPCSQIRENLDSAAPHRTAPPARAPQPNHPGSARRRRPAA